MDNIGILGGTFDPVHLGHLKIAEEARLRLNLKKVLFIPTGQPWLKADQAISSAKHRLEMVHLATSSNHYFSVSTIETDRPGPSYSVDTIMILQQTLVDNAKLFFILGLDAFLELPQWKHPEQLIETCKLVVVTRPHCKQPDLTSLEKIVPNVQTHIVWLEIPPIEISSTDIRSRISSGRSLQQLVPPNVEAYIRGHQLYSG